MSPDESRAPEPPLRIAAWAVGAFLGTIGLLFGLFTGQPWPSKDVVLQLTRDVIRLDRADEMLLSDLRAATLTIQALRHELDRLKERETWLEQEVAQLQSYVYPQPSGRVRRPAVKTP